MYCSNILTDEDMNAAWDSANINIRKSHRFLLYRSLEKGEWALSRLTETETKRRTKFSFFRSFLIHLSTV